MASTKKKDRWWVVVDGAAHLAEAAFVQGRGSPNMMTLTIDGQPVGENEFWYFSGTLGTFTWQGRTVEARVVTRGLLRRDVELYVDGQESPRAVEGQPPPAPLAPPPAATPAAVAPGTAVASSALAAAPPAPVTPKTTLGLTLDAGLVDALRARAAASGMTVEAVAEQALRVFLDKPGSGMDEDVIRRLIREEMERGRKTGSGESV